MRRVFNIVMLLCATLICSYSIAQTTSVTFQVIDTDGQTWNNGTWNTQLGTAGQQPPQFVIAGTTNIVPNQQQSGNLDNTGNGAVTLTSNPVISPANSQWTFVFCPQATPANCQQQSYTISGVSQVLIVTPPGLRISATNPLVRVVAYFDGEIIGGNLGSQYFNLTDRSIHVCSTFTSACVWTIVGTGGSITGLTTGIVPQAGSSTTIVNSNPQLDNGVTTPNTLTYFGGGGFNLPSDGVHAGSTQWIGNTTLPVSLSSNSFGFIGPNSAAFASYFFQPVTTPPTVGQVLTAGTPAGSPPVIPLTYTTISSSGCGTGTSGNLMEFTGTSTCGNAPIVDGGSTGVTATIPSTGTWNVNTGSTTGGQLILTGTGAGTTNFLGSIPLSQIGGAGSFSYCEWIANNYICKAVKNAGDTAVLQLIGATATSQTSWSLGDSTTNTGICGIPSGGGAASNCFGGGPTGSGIEVRIDTGQQVSFRVHGATSPVVNVSSSGLQVLAVLFASLSSCVSQLEGEIDAITDSTTNTWGATITGGGAFHILAYCDGTNWTVMGK